MAHFVSLLSSQHFESWRENELWHVLLTSLELKRQLCHLSQEPQQGVLNSPQVDEKLN